MKDLIVLHRKGIQVIAGEVTDVDETAELVIVKKPGGFCDRWRNHN